MGQGSPVLGVLARALYPFLESRLDTLLPLGPGCCDFSSFGSFWRLEIAGKFTAHLWPSILALTAICESGVLALVWLLCPHSCCNFGVCLLSVTESVGCQVWCPSVWVGPGFSRDLRLPSSLLCTHGACMPLNTVVAISTICSFFSPLDFYKHFQTPQPSFHYLPP